MDFARSIDTDGSQTEAIYILMPKKLLLNKDYFKTFPRRAMKLAAMQIALGTMSVIAEMVLTVGYGFGRFVFLSAGFWCGVFFAISGSSESPE